MKAKILTIVMLVLVVPATKAQIINELLGQKATQTQYALQQIAAMKAYGTQLKNGYQVVKNGLSRISKTKAGDMELHRNYFRSLKTVNPTIRQTEKPAAVRKIYAGIRRNYLQTFHYLQSSGLFLGTEISYFQRVFSRLFDDCEEILHQLDQTLNDNQLSMTDEQRLLTIDQLQEQMQNKQNFARDFSREATAMAKARQQEGKDIHTSRRLHGIIE